MKSRSVFILAQNENKSLDPNEGKKARDKMEALIAEEKEEAKSEERLKMQKDFGMTPSGEEENKPKWKSFRERNPERWLKGKSGTVTSQEEVQQPLPLNQELPAPVPDDGEAKVEVIPLNRPKKQTTPQPPQIDEQTEKKVQEPEPGQGEDPAGASSEQK